MRLKLTLVFCLIVNALAQIDLQRVHIVTNINQASYERSSNQIVAAGDVVRLALVVEARVANLYSSLYLSPYRNLVIEGDTIEIERVATWRTFTSNEPVIRWYLILPGKLDTVYYNQGNPLAPWAVIPYREIPITSWNDQWEVLLSSLPEYDSYFPGTVWLKVAVAFKGQYCESRGIESHYKLPDGKDYGGLSPQIMRLTVKGHTGNEFVNCLMGLRNLPCIANANSWNGYWVDHQTKCWIGGNFHSFCQLAGEMAGRSLLKYFNQFPLPALNAYQLTNYWGKMAYINGDEYLLDNKQEIFLSANTFGIGDFIVKGQNQAIFYQDLSSLGNFPNQKLDGNDLVLGCWNGALSIAPLLPTMGDSLVLIKWQKRW